MNIGRMKKRLKNLSRDPTLNHETQQKAGYQALKEQLKVPMNDLSRLKKEKGT